jgi:POT family proton-dependent oligopeptide transporter
LSKYKTAPELTDQAPPGIPFIVVNEAAERFSYYGMRAILVIFMTKYLVDQSGQLAPMSPENARAWYHMFSVGVYLCPFFGAILADWLVGKYKTILSLSIVYCLGHIALALDETRVGLAVGLTLIAIGSGGIKPCVSAHVGDQFGPRNKGLLAKIFSWFYFSINLGAFLSTLLTPFFLNRFGPSVAFGVPGLLMIIATWVFWLGRHRFVHIPPSGDKFFKESLKPESLKALGKLCIIYVFVAMFWALFDQTGSSWVLQADQMDRTIFGIEILPSQIQAANPIMILLLIPVTSYGIYPAINKIFPLTPLRKISIGFFISFASFMIIAYTQTFIDDGLRPNIGWQILAYFVITLSEVFVSITCLEFSYTQAPKSLKSLVMALFFLSVAAGNLFVSLVNFFIQNPDGSSKLTGADYYYFFAYAMGLTAVLFMGVARWYQPRPVVSATEELEEEATAEAAGN